jgi:primosomal protein N' (replication factor Y) (superfamily II helicase)
VKIVQILLPKIGLFPLDYLTDNNDDISLGKIIQVPFRKKLLPGIVWQIKDTSSFVNLKKIEANQNNMYYLQPQSIEMIKRASKYYLASLGSIAKLVLPVDIFEGKNATIRQQINHDFNLASLNDEQKQSLAKINETSKPVLIKGVTGCGKTEIYFHVIAEALRQNKQCLIMLPEMAISDQISKRFTQNFGFSAAIWHSGITPAKKKQILRGILSKEVKVVIGTRSSLFLPYQDLGVVVVDEEHDSSYKQSDNIMYNARDMAVLLGSITPTKTLLISATPSLESWQNTLDGKYQLIEILKRYNFAVMPEVEIINMKKLDLKKNSWLSDRLINEIKLRISRGEQSLLFLNRRGYAPLMLCKSCGYRFECVDCSTSMIIHKRRQLMECHYCGYQAKIHEKCLECGSGDLCLSGPGIERIEEEIKRLFPDARTEVLSSEQTDKIGQILERIENNQLDILIGTQVITKGYHFPNLTLVGIVDADMGLYGGDFRSSEHSFQLLGQVGGRAGRADKPGLVLIQTYNPDNKIINALSNYSDYDFFNYEMDIRKTLDMPPFSRMVAIFFTGQNQEQVKNIAQLFVKVAPRSDVRILGPAEALILKVAGKYRYRIMVIASKKFNLQGYIALWLENFKIPSTVKMKIDIDPRHI